VLGVDRTEVGQRRLAWQGVQVQGQLDQHALLEVAHRRDEDRATREAGVGHDFRDVLVLQTERIELVGRCFTLLVGLDHGAATTGKAADGGQADRVIGGQHASIDQGAQHGDGAAGVTTRVGHALGIHHGLALIGCELGETEHPARCDAVRCGRIDDLGLVAHHRVDHGHRLARGVVVQAQNDQIHLGHEIAFGGRVLAAFGRDAHHLDGGHALQPLANLKSSGTGFAVDENLGHGRSALSVRVQESVQQSPCVQ